MSNAFFSDLLTSISERGRTLLRRGGSSDAKQDASDLLELREAKAEEASTEAVTLSEVKKALDLDKVPPVVGKAARKTLPGVTLSDAFENVDAEGKLHSYEIRGRIPKTGKIREVRVGLDGKILEEE